MSDDKHKLPLFVVTGSSAAGKTTVGKALTGVLAECFVVESDIFLPARHVYEDWTAYWHHVIFLCGRFLQNGRPVVMVGWVNPDQVESSPSRHVFSDVHYLGLVSDEAVQEARLRGRYPKERPKPPSEADVEMTLRATRIFREEAKKYSAMELLDTTHLAVEETIDAVEKWIRTRL